MQIKHSFLRMMLAAMAILTLSALNLSAAQNTKSSGQLERPGTRDARRTEMLKEEVRHRLVTLPYYSVFDWLQAEVKPDGTVTLAGEVTRPTTKDDAEHRVKELEGATRVVNNIEVLPLSPMDDQ